MSVFLPFIKAENLKFAYFIMESMETTCLELNEVINNNVSAMSSVSKAMRRVTKGILRKHEAEFKLMFEESSDSEMIINRMFADGIFNWGRIATVYAFASITGPNVGLQIASICGKWIIEQGGWCKFVEHFKLSVTFDESTDVHVLNDEDEDRKGPWMEIARDRHRFARRIESLCEQFKLFAISK